jgi:site-specific DNA-methyltransferase (adenine-specific)
MDELPDEAVSLTVTSPPYWNAIDYDRHTQDAHDFYRTRSYAVGFVAYDEYLGWLRRICSEVFRVTRPGGFCALVVGTVLWEGTHYPVPFDVTAALSRDGWEFHQDIIWHKVTGGVKRAGVFLQHPYPGYFYPNIMTEYILVFRKPGLPIYRAKSAEEKRVSQVATQRLFTNEIANTVWHIAPVPPGHLPHPCPFPEEIPHRLIGLYSYAGDTVLDPFCGSGQTLKVAKYLRRHYVGYDLAAQYVELSRQRVHEPPGLRAEQLVASFDKLPLDAPRGSTTRSPGTGEARGGGGRDV